MRCDALQQMSKITLACFGIFIPFESRTAYLLSISIEVHVEEKYIQMCPMTITIFSILNTKLFLPISSLN